MKDCRVLILLLITIIALMPIAALASDVTGALWRGDVRITNSGNTTATDAIATANISSQSLIDNNFASDNLSDVAVQYSSDDVAFMPGLGSNPWTFFVDSIGAGLNLVYDLFTGGASGGTIRYFPGDGGMTVTDNETLEPGNNFIIEQKGWVDTDNGSDKNLVYKLGAFSTYISADEEITAGIYAGTTNVTYRVSASADDAKVRWTGAAWELQSLSDVYAGAGYSAAGTERFGSGMRFLNVTIPENTLITSANITFDCNANKAGVVVKTVITGELTDASATFSTLANYQGRRGTIVGGATNDYITSANRTWDAIPAWAVNTPYISPDITDIIQEMVDHNDGWTSANVTLFWDDHGNRSTNVADANRMGHSWDDDASQAPLLSISYRTLSLTVTATNVSSGNHTVTTTANTTHLIISIDGASSGDGYDSTALGGASVPPNSKNWTFCSGDSMPYMEYTEVTINGTQAGYWEWEYSETFTDQSVNSNTATPTFRTTSSDNLSATLSSFEPISESKVDTFSLVDAYSIIIADATPDDRMFDDGDYSKLPAEPINAMLDDADVPRAAWWLPFIFLGICVIGFITYGATTMTRGPAGQLHEGQIDGSLLIMFIVMEVFLVVLGKIGPIPLWPSYLFPIAGIALILSRKHFAWG